METLEYIKCPACGHQAQQAVYASQRLRRGWYCSKCRHFEPAIGRERKMDKLEDEQHD